MHEHTVAKLIGRLLPMSLMRGHTMRRSTRVAMVLASAAVMCGLLLVAQRVVAIREEVLEIANGPHNCLQAAAALQTTQPDNDGSGCPGSGAQSTSAGRTAASANAADWQLEKPSTITGHEVEGYALANSVLPGQMISFAVRTTAPYFTAGIFRMGWYGGTGAKLMATVGPLPGHAYPVPTANDAYLVEANWPVAFSVTPTSSWASGVYMVKLTDAQGFQSYIPFVVKAPATLNSLLFVHAVNTDEAYNYYGNASLYPRVQTGAKGTILEDHQAHEVSFDRPFIQNFGAGQFFRYEYPFVRWAERSGYSLAYVTDLDIHQHPGMLLGVKGIVIVGHDEYWTKDMRDAYDAAVAKGVNLANFAANTAYWQMRYAPDSGGQPDRRIVAYKGLSSNKSNYNGDPKYGTDDEDVTTQFGDPLLHRSEQHLLGVHWAGDFNVLWAAPFKMSLPIHGVFQKITQNYSWLTAHTGLKNGSIIKNLIGYEFDHVDIRMRSPENVAIVGNNRFLDDRHHVDLVDTTIYTSPGGAVVFSAGTIDWSWGLDNYVPQSPDPYAGRPQVPAAGMKAVQQMTANILNRFLRKPNLKLATGA